MGPRTRDPRRAVDHLWRAATVEVVRKLKFLIKPSWLALAAVIALFAFLCFSVLAPWQLGKNTETSERNDLITQSVDAEPVPIGDVLSPAGIAPDDTWRRVIATGSYIQDKDALVRLRSILESPAYEVVTPFQLDDGPVVLVNRGYIIPVQGTQPPPFASAPQGAITLEARLRQPESPSREPFVEAGQLQVYSINPGQVGTAVGVDAINGYLQLDDEQPGGLGLIELPQTESGPYLSYGLQWLAFGIIAPIGLAYFIRAEWRERRKNTQRDILDSAADPEDPAAPTVVAGAQDTADAEFTLPSRKERRLRAKSDLKTPLTANDARLADRYGKSH